MGKQAKPFLLTHFDSIYEQDFQQGKIQLEVHVQNTISHQHSDNNWMEKCWRDLCKMKELLEEREEGQTEPRNELFLSKIHHVVGLISGGQSIIVYQMNRDIVWYVETCPKFPFRQETNWMLRFKALGSSVFSTTFLRPTASAGGSNTLFCLSSSRLCGNLRETTQLSRSITDRLLGPFPVQRYNKKPRRTKSPSLNGSSKQNLQSKSLNL